MGTAPRCCYGLFPLVTEIVSSSEDKSWTHIASTRKAPRPTTGYLDPAYRDFLRQSPSGREGDGTWLLLLALKVEIARRCPRLVASCLRCTNTELSDVSWTNLEATGEAENEAQRLGHTQKPRTTAELQL